MISHKGVYYEHGTRFGALLVIELIDVLVYKTQIRDVSLEKALGLEFPQFINHEFVYINPEIEPFFQAIAQHNMSFAIWSSVKSYYDTVDIWNYLKRKYDLPEPIVIYGHHHCVRNHSLNRGDPFQKDVYSMGSAIQWAPEYAVVLDTDEDRIIEKHKNQCILLRSFPPRADDNFATALKDAPSAVAQLQLPFPYPEISSIPMPYATGMLPLHRTKEFPYETPQARDLRLKERRRVRKVRRKKGLPPLKADVEDQDVLNDQTRASRSLRGSGALTREQILRGRQEQSPPHRPHPPLPQTSAPDPHPPHHPRKRRSRHPSFLRQTRIKNQRKY